MARIELSTGYMLCTLTIQVKANRNTSYITIVLVSVDMTYS